MGSCVCSASIKPKKEGTPYRADSDKSKFIFSTVIGKGGFGKVGFGDAGVEVRL